MTAIGGATLDAGRWPALTGSGADRLRAGPWRVAVVGAGGWLGLATLELLHRLLGDRFARRVASFGSSARALRLRGGVTVEQRPLAELAALPPAPTLVLHLAFLTQEKAKAMAESDYVAANRDISATVLAALDRIDAEAVFVPSSGAAYLVDDDEAQASMRLYGRLKREDEAAFAAWAAVGDRRAAIARVFNLSGPYINKQSSYALACFIADALAGRPIQIRADRPVLRSYVSISDLMSVVFGVLTDRRTGTVLFDTAGDDIHEMSGIAEAVAAALGDRAGVRRPPLTEAAADRYVGDGAAFARLRRAYGVAATDFPSQILETARHMAGDDGGPIGRLPAA